MPKADQKAVAQPATSKAKPVPVKPLKADKMDRSEDRPLLYPTLQVRVFQGSEPVAPKGGLLGLIKQHVKALEAGHPDDSAVRDRLVPLLITVPAIDEDTMKALLGWETLDDHRAKLKEENPDLTQAELDAVDFDDDGSYLVIKDYDGNKVRLNNNDLNREFIPKHGAEITQEFLMRNWAGPANGLTVNGEAFVIGQTGRTESIQHRGIGFVNACQRYRKQKSHWSQFGPLPIFESVGVFGVSESPKVIRTLDNGKERTDADVINTSGIFNHHDSRKDRNECSKMLSRAVKFLWDRMEHQGPAQDKPWVEHDTRTETLRFVENHKTLIRCVEHIFGENKSSRLFALGEGTLNVASGTCSALMYLMAASDSDPDAYRLAEPVPSERKLDMGMFDKAASFWAALRKGSDSWVKLVKELLRSPGGVPDPQDVDPELIAEARGVERQVILAKAWAVFSKDDKIAEDDVKLNYVTHDPETGDVLERPILEDYDGFGPIDLGPTRPKVKQDKPDEEEPTVKELIKKEKRKTQAEQMAEKLRDMRATKRAEQSATVGEAGAKNGKPPAPKLKGRSNADIQAQQTEACRKGDEESAKAGNKAAAAALKKYAKK
jgi:hypothetical protein